MHRIPTVLLGLAALAAPVAGAEPNDTLRERLIGELGAHGGAPIGETTPLDEVAFGPGTNVTIVKPAAFFNGPPRVFGQSVLEIDVLGNLEVTIANLILFAAPLDLPSGALIDRTCLLANDPATVGNVGLALVVTELDPTPAWVYDPVATAVRTGTVATPGWTRLCTPELDIPLRAIADLDADGTPGALTYTLVVVMDFESGPLSYTGASPSPSDADAGPFPTMHLGAAEIAWHRTLSPAPSSATFDDVPTDHLFFQQVEALASSGITAGCDADSYCPNAPLTRGQMAAFLAKALGLHWPD